MATCPNWPNLKSGQNNTNVKALQHLLIYHGADITADGSFGPATKAAVQAFQESIGLSQDGIAGKNTLSKLVVTVKKRTTNQAARAAQTLLAKFESLSIDGDFYTASSVAATNFQEKMGIYEPDSYSEPGYSNVDAITWQYLFGYDAYPSTGGGSAEDDVVIQNNTDYRGLQILSNDQISRLNANKKFYQNAAAIYGIPWQMIAAIHYREYGLRKAGPSNGNGPYQIWGSSYPVGDYTDAQFQNATNKAAEFIKGKLNGRDCSSDDNVKYGFFAYNGISAAYKTQAKNLGFTSAKANNGEGSPYVMNRYDKMRDPTVEPTRSNGTWGQIKTDGGSMVYPANSDYGAYVVYRALM